MPAYPIKAIAVNGFLVAVSDDMLPRAKFLVSSLISKFKARGYRFTKGKYKGRKKIIINSSHCEFIVRETIFLEGDRSHGGSFHAAGELQIRGRVDGSLCLFFRDSENNRIEEQLDGVVREFECRIKKHQFEASMRGKGTPINDLFLATPLAIPNERDIEYLVKVWGRLPQGIRAGIIQIAQSYESGRW